MNTYQVLLSMYAGFGGNREWMSAPFSVGDLNIATDGVSMCIIEKKVCPELRLPELELKHCTSVIEVATCPDENMDLKIVIEQLNKILQLCPLIKNRITCDCCEGRGDVEYEFYSPKGKYYTNDITCPECDGYPYTLINDGKKPDAYIPDPSKLIKIGNHNFSCMLVERLIESAKLMKQDHIKMIYEPEHLSKVFFKISNATIILMPSLLEEGKTELIGEYEFNN